MFASVPALSCLILNLQRQTGRTAVPPTHGRLEIGVDQSSWCSPRATFAFSEKRWIPGNKVLGPRRLHGTFSPLAHKHVCLGMEGRGEPPKHRERGSGASCNPLPADVVPTKSRRTSETWRHGALVPWRHPPHFKQRGSGRGLSAGAPRRGRRDRPNTSWVPRPPVPAWPRCPSTQGE